MFRVISLDNEVGRARLERLKTDFEAVDGSLVLHPGVKLSGNFSRERLACDGCAKSHQNLARVDEELTVLEDDVKIRTPAAVECWSKNIRPLAVKMGADAIFGGASAVRCLEKETCVEVPGCACFDDGSRHVLVPVDFVTGFFMYSLCSEKARAVLLSRTPGAHIDNHFGTQIRKRNMRVYVVAPFVATCYAGVSHNRVGRFQDYSRHFRIAEDLVSIGAQKLQRVGKTAKKISDKTIVSDGNVSDGFLDPHDVDESALAVNLAAF